MLLKRLSTYHRLVKPLLFIGIMGLTLFFALSNQSSNTSKEISFEKDTVLVVNEGLELDIDVVDTSTDRSVGLSKYNRLKGDEAMLFVFEQPGLYSFWMRDMKFPIDIIWLNANKEIVTIKENADPTRFPESYYPTAESLYVLETVAGFAQRHNLQEGQVLSW